MHSCSRRFATRLGICPLGDFILAWHYATTGNLKTRSSEGQAIIGVGRQGPGTACNLRGCCSLVLQHAMLKVWKP